MKILYVSLLSKIKNNNLSRDIISSLTFRCLNILLNLIILPLSINILNQQEYGIWLTISALNAWVSIFDLGTQNTLRNKLAACVTSDSKLKLRGLLISNSLFFSFMLFILILVISALLYNNVDFASILNINSVNKHDINTLIFISLLVFGFKLFTNNLNSILFALQKTYLTLLSITCSSFISILILLFFIFRKYKIGLMEYGLIFLLVDVVISILFPLIYLKTIGFNFKVSYKNLSTKFFKKNLLSSNLKFFSISILTVFTFFSDNFFIGTLLSYDNVVAYNLVNRYFNSLTMLSVVILNPVWTQVSIYAIQKDMKKINLLLSKLYRYFAGFLVIAIILILLSNVFYSKFSNGKIRIDSIVTIVAAIATLQLLFNNIHAYILNGMNKTTVQIVCLFFGSIVLIPSYYLLLKYFNTGIVGSFIVQIIVFLPLSLFLPIYLNKYLRYT